MPYVDRSPLNYRVNTTDPLQIRRENRAPVNNQDGFGDTLYTLWHDESSNDMYQLVQKSRGLTTTTWIALGGSGIDLQGIIVDAFTPPGTNPVIPDASNQITITGGQVASSTIGANVIRTDSLAANTFTIEIQQSGAAASQNTTLNGVCHFDSSAFTVTNGFVELVSSGTALTQINVDNGVSPVVPDPVDGSMDFPDGNGIAITGSGTPNNILTIDMNSPFTGDFTFQKTTDTVESLIIRNTSDTSNASSFLEVQVAGSSSSDPIISWSVDGVTQYTQYIDNSDADSLKTSLTGLGTVHQFFTTGERILPFQPLFIVDVDTSIPAVTGDGTQYTVVYDTVHADIGNNFSGGTTFTAPQTGSYFFIFRVRLEGIDPTHTLGELQIATTAFGYNLNLGNIASIRGAAPGANQYGAQVSCIAQMTLGDTATTHITVYNGPKTIALQGGGSLTIDNSFSGWFLG